MATALADTAKKDVDVEMKANQTSVEILSCLPYGHLIYGPPSNKNPVVKFWVLMDAVIRLHGTDP